MIGTINNRDLIDSIFSDFSLLERAEDFRHRKLRGENKRASRRIKFLRRPDASGIGVLGPFADRDDQKCPRACRSFWHRVRQASRHATMSEVSEVLLDTDKVSSDPLQILDDVEKEAVEEIKPAKIDTKNDWMHELVRCSHATVTVTASRIIFHRPKKGTKSRK